MTANLKNIKNLTIGAIVLPAVLAAARAENPVKSSEKLPQIKLPNDDRFLTSLEKTESPYEILTRTRDRQEAGNSLQAYSLGPVVAKARLEFISTSVGGQMSYLASNRSETTSVRPPELREAPPDAPATADH